jgi:hypothetical protein
VRSLALLLVLVSAGCRLQPRPTAVPDARAELAQRADSLAALDPEDEAREAIARGDLRFLATCGFACLPTGIDRPAARIPQDSLHIIAGTSDAVTSEEVARLNAVAREYASRYNQVILEARRARSPAP